MAESNIYLLRVMEGTRCVAEAPLIVHDKEATRRCWLEGFGGIAHGLVGATFQMMMIALGDQKPQTPITGIELQGSHSGLQIAHVIPRDGEKGILVRREWEGARERVKPKP